MELKHHFLKSYIVNLRSITCTKKKARRISHAFIIEKERDSLYKDGLQKGIDKGIVKGLEKVKTTKISIAQKLLKQDMYVETVTAVTGLSKKYGKTFTKKGKVF